jgi:hypothetical protein
VFLLTDSVNIPALVLPIVFIVIGAVISLVGAAYIVRLRRKLHRVEVADFDFEPSISVRSSTASIVEAVKAGWGKVREQARKLKYKRVRGNDYRELDFNHTHSMYQSL